MLAPVFLLNLSHSKFSPQKSWGEQNADNMDNIDNADNIDNNNDDDGDKDFDERTSTSFFPNWRRWKFSPQKSTSEQNSEEHNPSFDSVATIEPEA